LATATIKDVARLAGVSIKTVSRVTNKEANVRKETRQKVQRAIDKLEYRPNPSARKLAATRSYVVGLLYDNPSAAYLINVQNGALRASRAEGYDVVIYPCSYQDPQLVPSISSLIKSRSADGLILTPPLSDMKPLLNALDKLAVPFVLIAPADVSESHRAICTNDREVCAEMTRYLASLGHRRIGFVMGHRDHGAVGNRRLGYQDGLRSCGIKLDRKLVRRGDNSFESGERCGRGLLDLEQPPSAIFAANDDMAAGVMKAAYEKGLAIPRDLSVAGFDDIPLSSRIWPSLTTVNQPVEEMADHATALLLRQIRGERSNDIAHTVESKLVIRNSTGPLTEPARRPG
jgi:LacI family transcriptional regulator